MTGDGSAYPTGRGCESPPRPQSPAPRPSAHRLNDCQRRDVVQVPRGGGDGSGPSWLEMISMSSHSSLSWAACVCLSPWGWTLFPTVKDDDDSRTPRGADPVRQIARGDLQGHRDTDRGAPPFRRQGSRAYARVVRPSGGVRRSWGAAATDSAPPVSGEPMTPRAVHTPHSLLRITSMTASGAIWSR